MQNRTQGRELLTIKHFKSETQKETSHRHTSVQSKVHQADFASNLKYTLSLEFYMFYKICTLALCDNFTLNIFLQKMSFP